MLIRATQDSLFGMGQADDNARGIERDRKPRGQGRLCVGTTRWTYKTEGYQETEPKKVGEHNTTDGHEGTHSWKNGTSYLSSRIGYLPPGRRGRKRQTDKGRASELKETKKVIV